MAHIMTTKFSLGQTVSNITGDDLRLVKRLFLEKEYKDCAMKCAVLLARDKIHAIEQAFLRYYAASAHELLAQPMQNFSPSKLANLYDAKQNFELALGVLDEIRPRSRLSQGSRSSSGCSTLEATTPEQSIDPAEMPKTSPRTINFSRKPTIHISSSDTATPSKIEVFDMSPAQWLAGDSPVHTTIQTTVASGRPNTPRSLSISPLLAQKRCNCLLPDNRALIRQSSQKSGIVASNASIAMEPVVDPCFKIIVPTMRCSRLATELAALIDHHIAWIEIAIKSVVEAHQRRVDMTGLDVVDTKDKTMQRQTKMLRRKARASKRPRFDPSTTQLLCKKALEEL